MESNPNNFLALWLQIAMLLVAIGGVTVAVLAWISPRRRKEDIKQTSLSFNLYPGNDSPTIYATSGVPTLSQLLEGVDLDAKRLGLAGRLYEFGLEQFNHYVNNRDGVIEESRLQMAILSSCLDSSEVSLAESIGLGWMENGDCERIAEVHHQYCQLSPQAQIYAQHKRYETDALRRIARDLETNTPRTDYTSVKKRIASGNVSLDSLLSELPFFWQRIRALNDQIETAASKGRPPRRHFLHVEFETKEWGTLVDKHAERDGDWIVSNKHRFLVPYQEPVPVCKFLEADAPAVKVTKVIAIDHDPTSEWETVFWRKGGKLDQDYLRALRGESPEQLRDAYRRRMISRTGWVLSGMMVIVYIALIFADYL